MNARRWDVVVATVELACAIGIAVYFVVLGLEAPNSPDRTAFDRAFPFVLAALGLAVLGAMAWRSLRRARATPASAGDRGGSPGVERQRGPHAGTPRVPLPPIEAPELSEEGRAEAERLLRVLGDAGVLAPTVPGVDDLAEGVADAGEPVTAGSVLGALQEAEFWHPGFDAGPHLANLAFHDGHVEQFVDTLQEQVADLDRLVGGVRAEHVEIDADWRYRLRLRLGDRVEELAYPGHPKYLSSVLHVAVARAAHAAGTRLAWLWVDQGVWITVPSTGLEELNAGAPEHERWEWVDEQEPLAAGAPPPAPAR